MTIRAKSNKVGIIMGFFNVSLRGLNSLAFRRSGF